MSDQATEQRVVVVGGGIAGLSAALRLSEAGVPVSLVETSKRLGGRASSFEDPETRQAVDNCQHVLLRACTHLIDLYERLGVADKITWHKTLHFVTPDAAVHAITGDDLPAPAHLLRPMLGFGALSLKDRLAVCRGMLAVMQVSPPGRALYAEQSFADWLSKNHQPAAAVRRFWSPIVVSACNESLDRVAASYALQVFQEGFLASDDAYHMGLPDVPLAELYDPARAAIEAHGGEVLRRAGVEGFDFADGRVAGVRLSDGRALSGSAYVAAVPHDRLAKLATPEMVTADPRLQGLDELAVSPILGVHLWWSGGSFGLPHAVLLDSPVHWVFNKGADDTVKGGATHLHAVISAAHDLVDQPADALAAMAEAELRERFPSLADGEVVHRRVIKEKRATFSVQPGVDRLRPGATGAIANLLVAGDWADTGWPATMEGAVRSGYAAARGALGVLDAESTIDEIDDLEPGLVYRMVAG